MKAEAIWVRRGGVLLEAHARRRGGEHIAPQYDIPIVLGQSNGGGAAIDFGAGDQYTGLPIDMWHHPYQAIVPAIEPQSTPYTSTGMGCSNTFLKEYAEHALAAGRRLLVVNTAVGGTGFTTPSTNANGSGFHWRHDLADDANNLARRALREILAAREAAGPGARIVAALANHGSTDGVNLGAGGQSTFEGHLASFINWIREELDEPDLPYLMMQMRPDLIAAEPRHKAIDDGQIAVAAALDNVAHVPSPNSSEYFRPDPVHFNAAGQRLIGAGLYAAREELV